MMAKKEDVQFLQYYGQEVDPNRVDIIAEALAELMDFDRFHSWLCRFSKMVGSDKKQFRKAHCQLCPVADYVASNIFGEFDEIDFVVADSTSIILYFVREGKTIQSDAASLVTRTPDMFREFIEGVDHRHWSDPEYINVVEACGLAEDVHRFFVPFDGEG